PMDLTRIFSNLAVFFLTLTPFPLGAALTVYEGFQYGAVNDSLHGQPNDPGGTDTDATGLAKTHGSMRPVQLRICSLSQGV
ncbi:hypothetical protein N9A94_04870, partial [Akkermansiaceae bacterium]|nr:hypothetical protein [Akkermansiaceae bacterium]MDA7888056.1 hypothetical protein [Akkermansiaceae bacterium]